jgi:RNA recognition motif-containing protein
MNIFVAKLSYNTSDSKILNAFEAYGEVTSAKIVLDRETGRSKGFGFVEMPNEEEAKAAINGLNNTEMDGRTIVVKESEPREQRPSGGFNRGGGGYNRNRY